MKKIFFITVISVIVSLSFVQNAKAHFLATDNNIGALLHVDPNDDPPAGEQASFFFEFKDRQNKFQPKNCDCSFSITENGSVIYAQPLFQNNQNPNLTNASVFYTFPQKDVYLVTVVGKPLNPNQFQPFTLSWNFRVDQIASAKPTTATYKLDFFSTHFVHFIGGGIMLLLFLGYIIYTKLQKRKPVTKGGEKQNDKKDSSNMY